MKKNLLVVGIICLGVFLLSGCSNSKQSTLTCTKSQTITAGVEGDFEYKITYRDDIVEQVETTEKITSNQSANLKAYQSIVEKTYEPYKDIEHYNYDVKIEGDTMTSKVKIDYAKIDTDKLIKIDSSNGNLIKDGKVKLATIQTIYETMGATCK